MFREANDRIRNAAEKQGFSSLVPFICECDDARCTAIIRLPLPDYDRIRASASQVVVAPGHADERAGRTVSEHEGYVVVDTRDTSEAAQ